MHHYQKLIHHLQSAKEYINFIIGITVIRYLCKCPVFVLTHLPETSKTGFGQVKIMKKFV